MLLRIPGYLLGLRSAKDIFEWIQLSNTMDQRYVMLLQTIAFELNVHLENIDSSDVVDLEGALVNTVCKKEAFTDFRMNEIQSRLECIRMIHDMRKLFQSHTIVAIAGPQNAGKTTCLTKVFGDFVNKNLNLDQIGGIRHTVEPNFFMFDDSFSVLDLPGITDIDNRVVGIAQRFATAQSMLLIVLPFAGNFDTIHLHVIKLFLDSFGRTPILICLNKALASKRSLSQDTIRRNKEDYCEHLSDILQDIGRSNVTFDIDNGPPKRLETSLAITIRLTELGQDESIVSEMKDCHSLGIWTPKDVRDWIIQNVNGSNVPSTIFAK
jgi:tRNA U34 5-carboxymethylaminomethyl modifying GTPase MnmE/TrmE